jgi:Ran GTPase-activating protein (RanGAP) involved in mRNA processing and transport
MDDLFSRSSNIGAFASEPKLSAETVNSNRICRLVSMLEDMSLQSLNLKRNNLVEGDVQAIGTALLGNTWLQSLDMSYLTVSSSLHSFQGAAETLAQALEKNHSLLYLDISNNYLGDQAGARIFQALAMNRALQGLSMSSNQLGKHAACALADTLAVNDTVQDLDLSHNNFCNLAGEMIANALASNAGVQSLNLSYNSLGHHAARAMWQALKRNSTIQTLNLAINRMGEDIPQHQAATYFNHFDEHDNTFSINTDSASAVIYDAFCANGTLLGLNLSSNGLSEYAICAIAQGLVMNSCLTSLELSYNCVQETAAAMIGHALTCNNTLQNINLSYTYLGYSGVCALLFPGVSGIVCIQDIAIHTRHEHDHDRDRDRDQYDDIAAAAGEDVYMRQNTSDEIQINLMQTGTDINNHDSAAAAGHGYTRRILYPEGAILQACMCSNTSVRCLNLSFNNIGFDGACIVADGLLRVNHVLTSLDLSSNNLGVCELDSCVRA